MIVLVLRKMVGVGNRTEERMVLFNRPGKKGPRVGEKEQGRERKWFQEATGRHNTEIF